MTAVDQSISNACSIVHVVLNNNTITNTANNTPLHLHEDYTYGSYESSDVINGKRSWIDQVFGKAIWIKNNHWIIGLIGHIGTNKATFYAHNKFSGLSDSNNQWLYKNDGQWSLPEDPNDIRIEISYNETDSSVEPALTQNCGSSVTNKTDTSNAALYFEFHNNIHNFAPFENINKFREMEVAKGSSFFVSIQDKMLLIFNGHPKKSVWLKKAYLIFPKVLYSNPAI